MRNKLVPNEKPLAATRNRTRSRKALRPIRPLPSLVETNMSAEASPELGHSSNESQPTPSPATLLAPTSPSGSGDRRPSWASDAKSWHVFAQARDAMTRPMEMLIVIALGLCSGHRTLRTRLSTQVNKPA